MVDAVKEEQCLEEEDNMAATKKHPGFKAVQNKIAKKQGIPMERAGAILASAARKASPAAKRKNPMLGHVKGKAKK